MSEISEPKLAPPGAGLPAVEHFVARILFGLRRWLGSREAFTAKLQAERERIRSLVQSCNPGLGSARVLIQRARGLEDSSRNWSLWMTLDHLRIVNREMALVITALGNGRTREGQASTAAVKPSAEADGRVVAAYEESCDALLAAAAGVADLKTTVRFAHPWFGPLDAAGWYALAGGHMAIHRVQIERILAGLPQ